MNDVKNWILLIVLINTLLLPIMWLRENRATPRVLGISESTEASDNSNDTQTKLPTEYGFLNLFNFTRSNTSNNYQNRQVRTIEGDIVDSNLPQRQPISNTNKEQPLTSALSKSNQDNLAEGKIVLREGFKNNLAIKGFDLGDKIKLKCGDKEIQTVIDSSILATADILGVASNNIFSRLDINTNENKEVVCRVTKTD